MLLLLYCCGCEAYVTPRLTDGREIYSHRPDLYALPFWKCDRCNNFVGCHHKTANKTKPLGCIPNAEIKRLRKKIHSVLDPIWQQGKLTRKDVYKKLSLILCREYHTAHVKTAIEADEILNALERIKGGE
jgi:hypothetical protein